MRRLQTTAAAILCALACTHALAQSWPSRPIRFIVPTAPGGGIDVIGRLIAPPIGDAVGQPGVVENRGGLGGQLGIDMAAKAPADGHTVLVGTDAIVSQMPLMKLPYDPFGDFEPVAILATIPYGIVVNPAVANDLAEFIGVARSKPEAVSYGTPGIGSPQHMIALWFGSMINAKMLHVPYKGGGEIVPAVIGGQVHALFQPLPAMMQNIRGGKLRALAVTVPQRSEVLPDVPTTREAGLPELNVDTWFAIWVPAGTPREIVQRLRDEAIKALQTPAARDRLGPIGYRITPGDGEQLRDAMKRDLARWTKLARDHNLRLD